MPALIVRFPDGTREFRYPERPLDVGDGIWHGNVSLPRDLGQPRTLKGISSP
jgi:hypothetical protein